VKWIVSTSCASTGNLYAGEASPFIIKVYQTRIKCPEIESQQHVSRDISTLCASTGNLCAGEASLFITKVYQTRLKCPQNVVCTFHCLLQKCIISLSNDHRKSMRKIGVLLFYKNVPKSLQANDMNDITTRRFDRCKKEWMREGCEICDVDAEEVLREVTSRQFYRIACVVNVVE